MTQGIQVITTQSCDPNSVPETPRMKAENRLLQAVLCLLCACAHMHKGNKIKTKKKTYRTQIWGALERTQNLKKEEARTISLKAELYIYAIETKSCYSRQMASLGHKSLATAKGIEISYLHTRHLDLRIVWVETESAVRVTLPSPHSGEGNDHFHHRHKVSAGWLCTNKPD